MNILKITALALAAGLPALASAQTAAPAATDTPAYVNLINDDSITSRLTEAGYENIAISREGNKLSIDATKEGKPTNLVYDLTTGALTTVDGAGYSVETSAPAVTTGDATKDGMTDQGGVSGSKPDTSEPQGGPSSNDSGSESSTPETTEPSDGGNVNN